MNIEQTIALYLVLGGNRFLRENITIAELRQMAADIAVNVDRFYQDKAKEPK